MYNNPFNRNLESIIYNNYDDNIIKVLDSSSSSSDAVDDNEF